ncbi:MAG: right-handed parallel beta-helix repeat-containing protein [Eubacteriales bacterium]|nr:right-handed parallel beta-helix repeat-containing protein [Eubacteriales bacterium]
MIIYVDSSAAVSGNGTKERPYKAIQEAANIALPGDEVLVLPGLYREAVDPKNAGTGKQRITYRSVVKGGAHITGSESVKCWKHLEEGVWTVRIPNGFFGSFNPFKEQIAGDWYIASMTAHKGEVYLNEKSMYEVLTLDEVKNPRKSEASWDPDFSLYTWFTQQSRENDETILYANFHDKDPNKENVEISVRRTCFYPSKEHVSYITLSGFKVSKAATQWAPPTAYQEGMVGPHWSKGWIIEDCEIYESKCSGISLGKYLQPENDNKWLKWKYKDGTQTERDCICQASYEGWNKENIGSHIVRNCDIHDCGQTGIVGHLGGVFSIIEGNHIHHINNKQNLAGAEIGGIKMHAAIDTIIRGNHIHNCTRGLWLDWQAQGTRVTGNLFHDNCLPVDFKVNAGAFNSVGEDIFVEVSHGPTLIDHNLLLSDRALKLAAQGIAVIHNLIFGSLVSVGIGTDNGAPDLPSPRYTPYHKAHGTEVAGFMTILHGDMRFYNNIFVQKAIRPCMQALADIMGKDGNKWDDCNVMAGTFPYNGYPCFEEWSSRFEGYCGMGADTGNLYYDHLPVWAFGNLYYNGARPWEKEAEAFEDTKNQVTLSLERTEDGWYLRTNLYDIMPESKVGILSTEKLGMAFEPEQKYENPDGSPITFCMDYFGNNRDIVTIPGPFLDKEAALRKLF